MSVRTLADGSTVRFRPLVPGDRQALLDAFDDLSADSRYSRFLSPIAALSEDMLKHLVDEVDQDRHFALVAYHPAGEPEEEPIAIGRWVRATADPTRAEVAVTVADRAHGHGIGTAMILELAEEARRRGVRTFTGIAGASNTASLGMLRKAGPLVSETADGPLVEVVIDLTGTSHLAVPRRERDRDLASVRDAITQLDKRNQPVLAEDWDSVGLVVGDPEAPLRRVLFAVDAVPGVVDEAVHMGADLLVVHHPILLRAVRGMPATSPAGRLLHQLVHQDVALFVAHSNAKAASPGVDDALSGALGLSACSPLQPSTRPTMDKLVTFVPAAHVDQVVDAMSYAGAGRIGDYYRCAYTSKGTGTFVAGHGARPTIGRVGRTEVVKEVRVEMVLPRRLRTGVVRALLASHPYEEPAFDVYELASTPGKTGFGRVGNLPEPCSLAAFLRLAAQALPTTTGGLRAAGDPDRLVRRVAVASGSGGRLLDAANDSHADAFLTADMEHHVVAESVASGGPALVDAPHWATEWPWLRLAARRLQADLETLGYSVEVAVSTQVTDPWSLHQSQRRQPQTEESATPS